MFILLPKEILIWLDENRGSKSRQAFVIECLFSIKNK